MNTFNELDLIEPIQRALAEKNYQTPTPIQAQTIPAALAKEDVLGCAQTGTGKTAAFSLPLLNHLGQRNRKAIANHPFALVLAPTRELAIQIGDSFAAYGKHLHIRQGLVYGGVNQNGQVRNMNRGVHILVATPGRLIDLMNQGFIKLSKLEMFVLDEADRMLDMGFLPDLKRIIAKLPAQRQSLFFSATLPPNITDLSEQLLRDPISVNVTPKKKSLKKISQEVLFVEKKEKQSLLQQILKAADVDQALVFTKTKRTANNVSERLTKRGVKAAVIHGNKSQNARQRALESFRRKQVRILVATDVASRGIDINGISHVINYDLPFEPEAYVHRIGRTGRAGAKGVALSFCSSAEHGELRAIEDLIGQKVPISSDHPQPKGPKAKRPSPSRSGRKANFKRTPSKGRRKPSSGAKQENAQGASSSSVNPKRTKSKSNAKPEGFVYPSASEGGSKKAKPKRQRQRRKAKVSKQHIG